MLEENPYQPPAAELEVRSSEFKFKELLRDVLFTSIVQSVLAVMLLGPRRSAGASLRVDGQSDLRRRLCHYPASRSLERDA